MINMNKTVTLIFEAARKFMLLTMGLTLTTAGKINAQVATIGTGTLDITQYNPVSVGGTHFFNPALAPKNTHIQLLYTKAEINAAGITAPGMIDSIAWDVAAVPGRPLVNYTIKGKLYTPDSLTGFTGNNLATLSTTPSYLPTTGWSWIRFQTPLYWNGVDNIVFDICSDTVTAPLSGRVRLTSSTTGPNTWALATAVTPLCGVYPDVNPGRLKPNIKIAFRTVACSAVPPSVSITPSGTLQGCDGKSKLLELSPIPSGPFAVQWQVSVNGGSYTPVTIGGNNIAYIAQITSGQSNQYRAVITCPGATSPSVTSNVVTINAVGNPYYASLPYSQDFESWSDRCSTLDIPDSSWLNEHIDGPFSWRREDQGASANWKEDVNPLYYNPTRSTGSHSARVQTSKGAGSGALFLHVNCDGNPGAKELRFDYYNKTGSNNPLSIFLSKDGGLTYDSLTSFNSQGVSSAAWTEQIVSIPSDAANTIIKFLAISSNYQSGDFDMGIDNVRVLPACSEQPVAGNVDSVSACLGSGVLLSLSGNTVAAGILYNWQESTDGISWKDIPGGNVENPTPALNGPTWYRCIVTCANSNLSDTTTPRLATVSPFYYCYCNSGSTIASKNINIGNVQIRTEPAGDTLLNNGNPLPATSNLDANQSYTNYTGVAPAELYLNNTYKFFLTFMTANGTNVNPQMGEAVVKAWIDYDHSGTYDANEQIMGHLKASSIYVDSSIFTIPATAKTGITSLRIVTNAYDNYDTTLTTPCGSYGWGETEDYLVHIYSIPCAGTPDLGNTVYASDSLMCPGYSVTLTHPDYDTTTGQLSYVWQSSTNGSSFSDIPGSENQSTITSLFPDNNSVWYRLKATCGISGREGYSNEVKVNKHVVCYCVSYADGGFAGLADSSDIGGFTFHTLNFPLTGGHLNNPDATRGYTNRSHLTPTELYVDSTYSFSIDHIILRNFHADAKITMFIDYNANGTYDVPDELVYTGVSELTGWQKSGSITIPSDATLNQPTGIRVIINNNTNPNIPSDEACGIYTSGETEDFVVIFLSADTVSDNINKVTGIVENIKIYPNPTQRTANIAYQGGTLSNGSLIVQTITGTIVETRPFKNLKNGELIQLDFSSYSKGVYIITLKSNEGNGIGKIVLQ